MFANLSDKGLIIQKTENGIIKYANAPFVIGIFEFNLNNLSIEFLKDVESYMKQGFAIEMINSQIPQMRVIPINESIKNENLIMIYDEFRQLIEKSPGPFAVADCICKKGHDIDKSNCKKTKLRETCINMGTMGEMYIKNGVGRKISKDEAFQIIIDAEKEGLVIQTMNAEDPQVICACCGCCCGVLAVLKRLPRPVDFTSSHYYALIDSDICTSCGICFSRCQMDAIQWKDGNTSYVKLERCIGCGLCVVSCPVNAISLKQKENIYPLPEDRDQLYRIILENKKSTWERIKMLGNIVLKRKC
jgi:NAD-dependent dihydropyrimidine dehydrogenase PreA subunit